MGAQSKTGFITLGEPQAHGTRSGRTMARTGLRMMPTFPSSPLKFRTAGFPQYGFKAGVSAGPSRERRPRVASSRFASCLRAHRFQSLLLRSVSEYAVRSSTAIRAATPLYPRGPRSGPGYAVPVHHHLSGPIRPTRGHIAISPLRSLYALPSLCVCRLGDPRLVPCFHCSFFLNMSPSTTPGSPAAAYTQFLRRQRWPSSL